MLTNTHLEALCIAAATGSKSQLTKNKKNPQNNKELRSFHKEYHQDRRKPSAQHPVWSFTGCYKAFGQRDAAAPHIRFYHSITWCRLPEENIFSGRPVHFTNVFLCERLKAKVQLLPFGFFSSHAKNFPVKITQRWAGLTLRLRVRFSWTVMSLWTFFFIFPKGKRLMKPSLTNRAESIDHCFFFFQSWLWNKSTFRHLLMGQSTQPGQQGAIRASHTCASRFQGSFQCTVTETWFLYEKKISLKMLRPASAESACVGSAG